ncbi:Uncharacterised protein [Mycobacteroides abscessus subsp. abscessus]|nr:Uncharacterised protein [Mycobacteroides abscessus subsp. abscessus]
MLTTVGRTLEGVAHHSFHPVAGVDADLGRDLVRGVDADRSTVSGVRTLRALADHDEVDVRVARQRRGHPRETMRRPQIDVMVEREPHLEQQAAFEHSRGHRRIADGAEEDRVVLT